MMSRNFDSASRRQVLAGLAGLTVTSIGGLDIPKAQAAHGPSGMPWLSGCSINQWSAFEQFRGRKIDTITTWCPHNTWGEVVALKGGFITAKKSGARVSVAIAPLPRSHHGNHNPDNWRLAANGNFDHYYNMYSLNLQASGEKDVICRVGWEVNQISRPWFCDTDSGAAKQVHRLIVAALRRYNPTIQIEWNNIKKGAQKGSILDHYPGDDVVDIIGVNYYDGWPPLSTQAIWNSQFNASVKGGPWGIGAWYDFAASRGKSFSCSEWGVNGGRYDCVDNPLYIENMHQFFSDRAGGIAYENYFNQRIYHQLTPDLPNPQSSAKYKQLWGA